MPPIPHAFSARRCGLGLALALLALTASAADERIAISPAQQTRAGVVTATLSSLTAATAVRLPTQVIVPPAQVEVISAPVPALVVAIRAAYGESVRKGQVLATLRAPQLLELQRELGNARAQAALASENLRRDESLHAEGIIAANRLAATRATEQQATLLLAERRQTLALAGGGEGALSGSSTLRAPFDAVVLEAAAQPGSRVDALTPLFKLGRLAPLWLEIQASPAQAAGIAAGDPVSIPGCAQPGRVILVAPHIQAASQSLLIRAEFSRPDGCIKPAQYTQAEIAPLRAPAAGSWRLPAAAVVRHQGQAWVFAALDGGFRPLAVKVLEESAGVVLVAADLPPTTRLAVKGVAAIKAVWAGLGAGDAAASAEVAK